MNFLKDLFIYLRKREHACAKKGQREREPQEDSAMSAEPNAGLNLVTPRS